MSIQQRWRRNAHSSPRCFTLRTEFEDVSLPLPLWPASSIFGKRRRGSRMRPCAVLHICNKI